MKRSRILLAISSGILAIAGVAAAKSTHFGSSSGFFITYQRNHVATLPVSKCLKASTGATCITTLVVPNSSPVQTYKTIVYTNSTATHKLLYQVL